MTPIHVTVDSDTGQATYSEWHPEGVDVPRPELTAAMEDLRERNIRRRIEGLTPTAAELEECPSPPPDSWYREEW